MVTFDYRLLNHSKKLLPIVFAAVVWGREWRNKSILCWCDNEAVVHIINTGTSRDPTAMSLMRYLYFIAAKFNLLISAIHLAGKANSLADALSRNNLSFFLSSYPQANHLGTPIPDPLISLLVDTKPDWTSQSWSMFNTIFSQPCPKIQCAHIPRVATDTQISAPVPATSPSPLQSPSSVSC